MKARLTGGLAAAALLATGVACTGAAHAADPGGYPHDLGFEPSKLIATADAVYAVGGDGENVHVAEVGGAQVVIDSPAYLTDAVATPDGSSLWVVTADDDGQHYWAVDTDDLTVTADGDPTGGTNIEALGTDSDDVFEVYEVPEQGLGLGTSVGALQLTESDATDSAAVGEVAARGDLGHRTWYAAGTAFGDETQTATLWSYDEDADAAGIPVELGAAGDPDANVEGLAVDGDTVYALSWRDNDEGPQTYGLTVVDEGVATAYLPLSGMATDIALSPDGGTLYLASGYDVYGLDTAHLAEYADETDGRGVSVDSWLTALAVDGDGHVFVGDDAGTVHAFSAAAAPAALAALPDPMSTTGISASWGEGKYAWEIADEDLVQYTYTVRHGDDVVASDTTFDQVAFVDGLEPGTTYTVEVAVNSSLLAGEPTTTQVTTYDRFVGTPSAVAVQGSMTVGSQLSLASTGAWEAGTDLSYEWYGSNGEMGGAIGSGPTLPLTAEHLGMTITGVVTGTKAGVAGKTLSAAATGTVSNPPVVTPPVVTPPAVTPPTTTTPALSAMKGAKPSIDGKAKVGRTLSVETGAWTKGAKLTYQWSANGKEIKGADEALLKLKKTLKGKRISVEVTGTKAGFTTLTRTSDKTAKVKR